MTTKHSTAPAPAAATHELVAHPLALDTARGFAALVIAATIGAGAVAGAVLVHPAFLLVLVLASIPAVYGWALLANLKAERRRFYAAEVRDQRDYDGDGVVGEPAGHIVTVSRRGQEPVEYVLPDTKPPKGAPALAGFPVTANDVLQILDGLRDGRQVAFPRSTLVLASGTRIAASDAGRETWRAVQDGFIAWEFAEAREGSNGREVWLRPDVTVEQMKHLVRQGANLK